MWQPLFPGLGRDADHPRHERRAPADVRRASRSGSCSTRTSATTGSTTPASAAAWEGVCEIPNAELWAARCEARGAARRLPPRRRPSRTACSAASSSTTSAGSRRASIPTRSRSASRGGSRPTSGFHLLNHDPERARQLFGGDHAGPARDRRQGAPERRARKGQPAAPLPLRARRPGDRRPRRDRRGLRHRHRRATSSPAATSG